MGLKIQVAASILSADFFDLGIAIKKCESSEINRLHIDVMDGHFVPNITIGPCVIKSIKPKTKLPIDAHLMIENPWLYIEDFVKAGSNIITLHVECYGKRINGSDEAMKFPKLVESINNELLTRDLKKIKSLGAKPAISLNPDTPLCVKKSLDWVEEVLIMSVNPGFAGQKFIEGVIPKIQALREIFKKDISVDGGINDLTAPLAVRAGANILVTASYFFSANDPKKAVLDLKNIK